MVAVESGLPSRISSQPIIFYHIGLNISLCAPQRKYAATALKYACHQALFPPPEYASDKGDRTSNSLWGIHHRQYGNRCPEKGNHLINDIFQECKNTLLTRTHYDILHSPNIPRGNGVSLTGQPGIGGYSRKFMSRNF